MHVISAQQATRYVSTKLLGAISEARHVHLLKTLGKVRRVEHLSAHPRLLQETE